MNIIEIDEMTTVDSANSTRILIERGCDHFWSKRGGDPYSRKFNGRDLPAKKATGGKNASTQ